MPSIFTKIVNGEIPSYKVAESEEYYAFLDINPLMKGHTLVIPKMEVDYLFDLDDDTYNGLFSFAKTISHGIKKAVNCKRIGVVVMGMEVPHAHIHLIPMNQMNDMNFSNEKLKLDSDEMIHVAKAISSSI
jgi:histidine triad (HIT) family protein